MSNQDPLRLTDALHRFLIDGAGVRGVLVRLNTGWQAIRDAGDYPPALATLLGESAVAASLFGGHTKIEGSVSVQFKGQQALRTLFAEYRAPGLLRGIAHWNESPETLRLREIGVGGVLAITLESPTPGQREPTRYQGLVGLDADSLAQAFEQYFTQSEQLPTRMMFSVDGDVAAGILLQTLPGSEADPDAWTRVQALFDTLTPDELRHADPAALLYRLFHEDGVRVLGEQPLRFECTCSRERVGRMLHGLGEEEAVAALQADGAAEITCEFCNQRYRFDRIDMTQIFAGGGALQGSTTPQ